MKLLTYLVKPGELTLKGGNREEFELCLRTNLRAMAAPERLRIQTRKGRFYVRCEVEAGAKVETVLDRVLGIAGWARARVCEKTLEAVIDACREEGRLIAAAGAVTFKIEARRADKSFPFDSYRIMREAGAAVLEACPGLRVDVKTPDRTIDVEIRENAYVYGNERPGRRGLPVGTGGKALLLLSGGIDSPVAGYRMAARGMRLAAVYFHAYPYTSNQAKEKVRALASIISRYALPVRLTVIPFTKIQVRIKERAPEAWTTLLMRMAMMDLADRLARAIKAKCLITGESIGQVASQTIENIACSESKTKIPVLRPLIGTDKIDTIACAKEIGTYDTSILPYADCCVLFSPKHPILKADREEANKIYESLDLEDILQEAFAERVTEKPPTSLLPIHP